jgi:hypothetical protein
MSIVDKLKSLNRKWIVAFCTFMVIAGGIIYLLVVNISEGNRLRKKEAKELQLQLEQLQNDVDQLYRKNRQLTKSKDSLQQHVSYMWPMRSIVYNAKLRDKAAQVSDFQPGQRVRVKADSSIVVITDYIVGGNNYNYFVHYRTKNKKGEFVEYSPYEIEGLNQQ